MGQRAQPAPVVAEQSSSPKLLDRVRPAIRARHYSLRTEEAFLGWIRRFPAELDCVRRLVMLSCS
jgi:hypothetical protein